MAIIYSTLDRRVVRTRKLLQDALFELILKKGYDSIRVQDITEEANLGRATFYVHYKDKEDLLLATIESTRHDLLEHVKAESAYSSLPGFRVQFQHAAKNKTFYLAVLNRVQGRKQIRSVMIETVQDHLESISPDSPIPIEIVGNFLVGAVLQLLDWWLTNDMPYSIDEMEAMFLKLIRQGLPSALDTDQIINFTK
jgi:AcrR family transcriptional regulator